MTMFGIFIPEIYSLNVNFRQHYTHFTITFRQLLTEKHDKQQKLDQIKFQSQKKLFLSDIMF